MVDTSPTRGLENAEDASSHVEATTLHQLEAVGDDDAVLIQKRRTPPRFSLKEKMTRRMVYEYWLKIEYTSLLLDSLPFVCGCFIYYLCYVLGDAYVILMIYEFSMTDYDQYG